MPTTHLQLPSGSALGAYASLPSSARNHQTTQSQGKFTAPKSKGKLKQGAKGAHLLVDDAGTVGKKKIQVKRKLVVDAPKKGNLSLKTSGLYESDAGSVQSKAKRRVFKKGSAKKKKESEEMETAGTASEMNGNGPEEEPVSDKLQGVQAASVKIIIRDVKLPDLETQTTRQTTLEKVRKS